MRWEKHPGEKTHRLNHDNKLYPLYIKTSVPVPVAFIVVTSGGMLH